MSTDTWVSGNRWFAPSTTVRALPGMIACSAFLLCPIVPLVDPDYASAASAQMVQHSLGDFETHAEAL